MKRYISIITFFLLSLSLAGDLGFFGNPSLSSVILCSEKSYYDCIIAHPASFRIGAPILVVNGKNLDISTENALEAINPQRIYLIGGPSVLSKELEDLLVKKVETIRLWGITQYGTSNIVAKYFWPTSTTATIVNDESVDNLILSKNYIDAPILLTKTTPLASTIKTIQEIGVKEIQTIGTINLPYTLKKANEKKAYSSLVVYASNDGTDILSFSSPPFEKTFHLPNSKIEDFRHIILQKSIKKIVVLGNIGESDEAYNQITSILSSSIISGNTPPYSIRREALFSSIEYAASLAIKRLNTWLDYELETKYTITPAIINNYFPKEVQQVVTSELKKNHTLSAWNILWQAQSKEKLSQWETAPFSDRQQYVLNEMEPLLCKEIYNDDFKALEEFITRAVSHIKNNNNEAALSHLQEALDLISTESG